MKYLLSALLFISATGSWSQLNQKFVEKNDGTYIYCYHKNGKISTEEFHNTAPDYMAQGYAKAFDKTGKEIYSQATSRSGLLSSVHFSYYESGAVKQADYSAHPDAGIQWYKKTTYFDEDGKITGENEMSHDDRVTFMPFADSTARRIEKEQLQQQDQERLKMEREQFVKDSMAFYITSRGALEDGTVVEFIPDPKNGVRQQVISKSGKIIQTTTEYYSKTNGIHSIKRTYHKNGRIFEEFIYEQQIWHYREYNKKGMLVREVLNQSIAHSE